MTAQDDNDSGYQTCDSIILKERLEEARLGFPATLLEIPDATHNDDYTDLQRRIAKYNLNNHGLTITLVSTAQYSVQSRSGTNMAFGSIEIAHWWQSLYNTMSTVNSDEFIKNIIILGISTVSIVSPPVV